MANDERDLVDHTVARLRAAAAIETEFLSTRAAAPHRADDGGRQLEARPARLALDSACPELVDLWADRPEPYLNGHFVVAASAHYQGANGFAVASHRPEEDWRLADRARCELAAAHRGADCPVGAGSGAGATGRPVAVGQRLVAVAGGLNAALHHRFGPGVVGGLFWLAGIVIVMLCAMGVA